MIKAIFIPGNGGGTPRDNWFPYLKKEINKLGVAVIDRDFPDNKLARAKYWLPFIESLGADENIPFRNWFSDLNSDRYQM